MGGRGMAWQEPLSAEEAAQSCASPSAVFPQSINQSQEGC
jgi:hypothetical protein